MAKSLNDFVSRSQKEYEKNIKEGKMYSKEALVKFKYLITDLLSLPPDVCLSDDEWKKVIERTQKRLDK